MYGYYEIEQSSFRLVLEFMAGGSLKTFLGNAASLTTRNFSFAENAKCTDSATPIGTSEHEYNVAQAISWMRQAARGLAYLRDEKVRAHLRRISIEANGNATKKATIRRSECKRRLVYM